MDDFNSETDSDYTSYWRDWVSLKLSSSFEHPAPLFLDEDTSCIETKESEGQLRVVRSLDDQRQLLRSHLHHRGTDTWSQSPVALITVEPPTIFEGDVVGFHRLQYRQAFSHCSGPCRACQGAV